MTKEKTSTQRELRELPNSDPACESNWSYEQHVPGMDELGPEEGEEYNLNISDTDMAKSAGPGMMKDGYVVVRGDLPPGPDEAEPVRGNEMEGKYGTAKSGINDAAPEALSGDYQWPVQR